MERVVSSQRVTDVEHRVARSLDALDVQHLFWEDGLETLNTDS